MQDFLPLWEVSEEELEGTGDKRWILMHGEVKQHTQELFATLSIQIQIWVLLSEVSTAININIETDYI